MVKSGSLFGADGHVHNEGCLAYYRIADKKYLRKHEHGYENRDYGSASETLTDAVYRTVGCKITDQYTRDRKHCSRCDDCREGEVHRFDYGITSALGLT